MTGADDDQLMAQLQAGSTAAFGELYDRYGERAYRVARSVCGEHGRAEEAVQEAFVAIWRSRATYRPQRGTVAGWLLTVVRHRAIDALRRNDKHASRRAAEDRLDAHPAHDDVAALVANQADAEHLESLLAGIPAPQREVIMLAFYGELTHMEIAARLGLSPGTVKGRVRLGLDKLRDELYRGQAA